MKTKFLKFGKYKIFKINLLKNQSYIFGNNKINKQTKILKDSIENLELSFKKAFNIIFEYHIKKKEIFFVGLPQFKTDNLNHLLKQTHHFFIPNLSWINGFLFNKKAVLRHLKVKYLKNKNVKDKKLFDFFLSLKVKPKLIVICNPKQELNLLKEFLKLKIPIVVFGNEDIGHTSQYLYIVPGNFKFSFKNPRNVFNLLLYSIFKRYPKFKKVNHPIWLKQNRNIFKIRKNFTKFNKSKDRKQNYNNKNKQKS